MRHSFVENANHCDSTRIIVYRLMLFENLLCFTRIAQIRGRIESCQRNVLSIRLAAQANELTS